MSGFNPDFWEVVVERSRMEAYANEDALWHESQKSKNQVSPGRSRTREAFQQVLELIQTELTQRQQEVVQLYYLAGLTETRIAERLNIPQQVVSQHLHGIVRHGKRVGGALPKLRKLCESRGITW